MTRKSTRWLMISVFVLSLGASMAPAAKKPSARNRQKHQAARIHQGAQSGSLTKRETHKLRHQQQAVHASIVRDRIDGGVFTPIPVVFVGCFFFFSSADFFSSSATCARALVTGTQSFSSTIGRSAIRTLANTPAMA